MMKISKKDNQYYAEFFERAVNAAINGESFTGEEVSYSFTEEDKNIMKEDAQALAVEINGKESKYIGRATSNESGDLRVDGKNIELKYVGQGKAGTYFNTSIYYFEKHDKKSFKEFMREGGLYDALRGYGLNPSEDNNSPVSKSEGDNFRHNNPTAYKQIAELDKQIRANYVDYIFSEMKADPDFAWKFVSDMLSKEEAGKTIPDVIYAYNYKDDSITKITKEEISSMGKKSFSKSGKFSIKSGNVRMTLAWQNGSGLNNPTIRVFI